MRFGPSWCGDQLTAGEHDRVRTRVAIVVSHPIQYFCHTYRSLAAEPDFQVRVLFASMMGANPYFDRGMGTTFSWQLDLLSGYEWRSADSDVEAGKSSRAARSVRIWRELDHWQPEVVLIHGYSRLECVVAWLWCTARARRAVLFGDGNGRIEARRPWLRRIVKRMLLTIPLAGFHRVLSLGQANDRYWHSLGVPDGRLVRAPLYLPDPDVFSGRTWLGAGRRESRAALGLADDRFVVMYSGKFQRRKRVLDLVEAIDRVPGATGLYVGDGDLRAACERHVRDPSRHLFVGFANIDRLASLYAAADVLVHPAADEPYGLVVAEAASMGLPIVATETTGALGEGSHGRLGDNAISYSTGDVDSLVGILETLRRAPAERQRMGRRSVEISDEVRRVAMEGLRTALSGRNPEPDGCRVSEEPA